MIECLVSLIIYAIILLIVVLVIEAVMNAFLPQYGQVAWLVRLLCGLLLLLFAISCIGGIADFRFPHFVR